MSSVTGSASMSARTATTGPGPPALEQRNDPVLRHAGLDLQAQLAEVVGDERSRLLLTVRQLGVLMNPMPDVHHCRGRFRCLLLDAGKWILRRHGSRCDQQAHTIVEMQGFIRGGDDNGLRSPFEPRRDDLC